MRWTIPTLIQQLVDAGVRPTRAGAIVGATYPHTRGDTFYRQVVIDSELGPAVGVYGIWNSLRADQSPLSGTQVSDDARTIAQFLRLNGGDWPKVVHVTGRPNEAVMTVVAHTVARIELGDYFAPTEVPPDDPKEGAGLRVASAIAKADGAADYLSSLRPPSFGA